MTNRVLLCIMDGWGISTGSEKYDATKLAHPVNVPELIKDYPSTKIHADGEYVGLPHGQMGNSEVGHLNLGAGRVVYQDLSKINRAIKDSLKMKNFWKRLSMPRKIILLCIYTDSFQQAEYILR